MNIQARISVAEDFSMFPAGRHMEDGEFNGSRFRVEKLAPALKGLDESESLEVTLDGVAGLGSSFLEEAFGGLVRHEGMSKSFLGAHLKISAKEEDLRDFALLAWKYIEDAAKT